MIIGYLAWPPDNGTYMWADPKIRGTPPPGVVCGVCEQRIDYGAVNPNYRPPKSHYDLCRTFDGTDLVSQRLRDYLELQRLANVTFEPLQTTDRYFVLRCSNILRLIRPPTSRSEEYCMTCGQYRSVWGNQPETARYEGVEKPLQKGLYVTDVRVGYYPVMGPLLVVGVETWEGMNLEKFKGLRNGQAIIN